MNLYNIIENLENEKKELINKIKEEGLNEEIILELKINEEKYNLLKQFLIYRKQIINKEIEAPKNPRIKLNPEDFMLIDDICENCGGGRGIGKLTFLTIINNKLEVLCQDCILKKQ